MDRGMDRGMDRMMDRHHGGGAFDRDGGPDQDDDGRL